jgi:hypothetical protein
LDLTRLKRGGKMRIENVGERMSFGNFTSVPTCQIRGLLMIRLVIVLIFLLSIHAFAVEKIVLHRSKGIDFLEKMDSFDYYYKKLNDIDIDDEYNFYFLDYHFGTILRVDGNTGKLINAISRRGQGPSELHDAQSIRVKNNMVFVSDYGFQGVKIFEKNGKIIKEFKTKTGAWDFNLDVSDQNKIFISQRSSDGSPCIAVYNIKGEYLSEFVKFQVDLGNRKSLLLNRTFIFQLDNEGNMIVVFTLKKLVQKFNRHGVLLWKKAIKNDIIAKFNTDTKISFDRGAVRYQSGVFDMDIDAQNNIVVGHSGGGVVYDKYGNTIHLIEFDPPANLNQFRLYANKLLKISLRGRSVNIYKFGLNKEGN